MIGGGGSQAEVEVKGGTGRKVNSVLRSKEEVYMSRMILGQVGRSGKSSPFVLSTRRDREGDERC